MLKFKINIHFRGLENVRLFEGWVLMRGVCLLDIPVSKVGAYSGEGGLFVGGA